MKITTKSPLIVVTNNELQTAHGKAQTHNLPLRQEKEIDELIKNSNSKPANKDNSAHGVKLKRCQPPRLTNTQLNTSPL